MPNLIFKQKVSILSKGVNDNKKVVKNREKSVFLGQIDTFSLTPLRFYYLFQCRSKQPFRVAQGKGYWRYYNPEMIKSQYWDLREILKDEIVIEFDTEDNNEAWAGIGTTAQRLYAAGIPFEVWDHGGKSPHLHIRNLPIAHLEKDKLRLMKKLFIQKFVPEEYLDCVDYSLCGIHLVALEWANHWKGKYSIKRLVARF